MGLKNKSKLRDQFKSGKTNYVSSTSWYKFGQMVEDPLKFSNSSELQKIKNRNRKNK